MEFQQLTLQKFATLSVIILLIIQKISMNQSRAATLII